MLRSQDRYTLNRVLSKKGSLSRNVFYKACKRGGAEVYDIQQKLHLTFGETTIHLSSGDFTLEGQTEILRRARKIAKDILSSDATPQASQLPSAPTTSLDQ